MMQGRNRVSIYHAADTALFIKEEGVTCYICATFWDNSSSGKSRFVVILHTAFLIKLITNYKWKKTIICDPVVVKYDGGTYTQDYIGLNTVTNPDDLYFHFTVDGSHLVFE